MSETHLINIIMMKTKKVSIQTFHRILGHLSDLKPLIKWLYLPIFNESDLDEMWDLCKVSAKGN